MKKDVERFICNCHACRRANIPRDKTPGYLYLLPIPESAWQHIIMDYKLIAKDKDRYNEIFVVINRFNK